MSNLKKGSCWLVWPPDQESQINYTCIGAYMEGRQGREAVCLLYIKYFNYTIGATEKSFFNHTNIVIEDNGIILLYLSQVLLRKERSPAYRNVCCGTGVGT